MDPTERKGRMVHALEYYQNLEHVKRAKLTKPEIIAVVLYTGVHAHA